VSETHHLSLGVALHLGCVQEWLAQRDVVLAIGTELASSDFWREPSPVGRCLIRLDIDPTQMVKGQRANVPLVGDAVDGVDGLLSRLRPRLGRRPESDLAAARSARVAEAEQLGARWLPYLQAIRQCLPAEAVITSDTAMACYYGALANLEVDTRGRYLHPTGLGTLGYSLPAAIGASRADPERPVVALSGDGGFQFTLQELGTAVDLGRSLPVIVFDNGGYGEIRSEMADRGSVPIAVDLRGPDLALLASAYGAVGRRTTTPEELRSALASALEYPGVTLLGVSEPSR
jgi:acetolactate synthase-1/2/3 large subunit